MLQQMQHAFIQSEYYIRAYGIIMYIFIEIILLHLSYIYFPVNCVTKIMLQNYRTRIIFTIIYLPK